VTPASIAARHGLTEAELLLAAEAALAEIIKDFQSRV
jgi:hypothetical protein